MKDCKQTRLEAAANPRRATLDDAVRLSNLFATAFMDDPIFDFMARPGAGRRAALELFFRELFSARDIPQNEVWMSSRRCCVRQLAGSWRAAFSERDCPEIELGALFPQGFRHCTGRSHPRPARSHGETPSARAAFLSRVCGRFPRISRKRARIAACEGDFERIDEANMPVYVESSNPKNINFYERLGFVARQNIAPEGAPPLVSMWRDARRQGQDAFCLTS